MSLKSERTTRYVEVEDPETRLAIYAVFCLETGDSFYYMRVMPDYMDEPVIGETFSELIDSAKQAWLNHLETVASQFEQLGRRMRA